MKHEKDQPNARREFLKTTAAAGAGAVITAVLPGTAVAAPSDRQPASGKPRPGYQVTQHVLDYYRTAKL